MIKHENQEKIKNLQKFNNELTQKLNNLDEKLQSTTIGKYFNEQNEKEFNEKGYVKLPFLNATEIEYLKKKFFDCLNASNSVLE